MINCISCVHYNLMYEENPKKVYDGCMLYNTYLKSDKNRRIIPCTMCNNTSNANFLNIRKCVKKEK